MKFFFLFSFIFFNFGKIVFCQKLIIEPSFGLKIGTLDRFEFRTAKSYLKFPFIFSIKMSLNEYIYIDGSFDEYISFDYKTSPTHRPFLSERISERSLKIMKSSKKHHFLSYGVGYYRNRRSSFASPLGEVSISDGLLFAVRATLNSNFIEFRAKMQIRPNLGGILGVEPYQLVISKSIFDEYKSTSRKNKFQLHTAVGLRSAYVRNLPLLANETKLIFAFYPNLSFDLSYKDLPLRLHFSKSLWVDLNGNPAQRHIKNYMNITDLGISGKVKKYRCNLSYTKIDETAVLFFSSPNSKHYGVKTKGISLSLGKALGDNYVFDIRHVFILKSPYPDFEIAYSSIGLTYLLD